VVLAQALPFTSTQKQRRKRIMGSLRAVNRKAKKVALQVEAEKGDVFGLADPTGSAAAGPRKFPIT
jgi:hypothetical protein